MKITTLSAELLHKMDAYGRTPDYLSVGQIYLYDNPLLKQPMKRSHVKPLVVGHRGTTPGLNFVYGSTRIAGRLGGSTASGRNRSL